MEEKNEASFAIWFALLRGVAIIIQSAAMLATPPSPPAAEARQ